MGNEVKWTKEQQQAIYEKGNNILVAAAAGSGKTAVLVERIINKIINEKVDNKLTFISKLALDRIITDLIGFGYEVKLSWINGINLDPQIEQIDA